MATAPPIVVLSSLALKGVLERFRPQFERALGPLELRFDATQAILAQLAAGTRADLLVLTTVAMDDMSRQGHVSGARVLGSSGIGLAVRAGAPKPDISTSDALVRTLLAANSVAQSKVGASGLYFSELLTRLEIDDKLKKRVVVDNGPVGLAVAAGEAEIGVQQLCELAPVAGIDIVGPLPTPLQVMTSFSAGVPANAANPQAGASLMALLGSDAARDAMRAGGMEPAAR